MAEPQIKANQLQQFQPPTINVEDFLARIEQAIKSTVKQQILPNAVYDYEETVAVTGFSLSTIIRADRAGRLAGRYEGRRRYFRGRDLLKWLFDEEGGDSQ